MDLSSAEIVRALPGFCQPVSSWSHLLAAGAAAIAAVPLVRSARGGWTRRLTIVVYAGSVVAMLAVSGAYHALALGCGARAIMKRLDYVGIWLLIAGTLTAVNGVLSRGRWRHVVLASTWIYAAGGIFLQAYRFDVFSGVPGLALYLGLGWFGGLSIFRASQLVGARTVRPFWYAGIVYSAGAVSEAFHYPLLFHRWVGPHEVFHLAVVAGVALHWLFIRRILLTPAPTAVGPLGA